MSHSAESRYVQDYKSRDGSTMTSHLDGVSWYDAPAPPRRHECWPQTEGWTNYLTQVWRCPCGAINLPGSNTGWTQRNQRNEASTINVNDLGRTNKAMLVGLMLLALSVIVLGIVAAVAS